MHLTKAISLRYYCKGSYMYVYIAYSVMHLTNFLIVSK